MKGLKRGSSNASLPNTLVGGSTVIGDNSWVAPSVCIRDGVSIGENSLIGMCTLVTKDLSDNEVWAGFSEKNK